MYRCLEGGLIAVLQAYVDEDVCFSESFAGMINVPYSNCLHKLCNLAYNFKQYWKKKSILTRLNAA